MTDFRAIETSVGERAAQWEVAMPNRVEKYRRMELRRELGVRGFGASVRTFSSSIGGYLIAYACFACRRSHKRVPRAECIAVCPNCGDVSHEMGRSFKAPATSDEEQWLKVQTLFAHGYRFFSYRSYACEPLPQRLREVAAFIAEHHDHPLRVADPKPELFPTQVGTRPSDPVESSPRVRRAD